MSSLAPQNAGAAYRGSPLALWLLVPVLVLKLIMGINVAGLNPLVSNRYIIEHADGVPIASFSAETQELVMFLFASWGLNLLLICAFAVVALVRYRALIPLAIFWLAVEQIGRKVIAGMTLSPAPDAAISVGALINWAFSIMLAAAFTLSLIPHRSKSAI